MKYIFITNRQHNINNPDIIIKKEEGFELEAKLAIEAYINKGKEISLDFETNSLDPYIGKLLLTAIYNNVDDFVIVIDNTSVDWSYLCMSLSNKKVLAHNAKFEYKFARTNGIRLNNLYCTMIAEQKMFQGSDFRNNIITVCERRGINISEEWSKETRNDFIDADTNIIFTEEHIKYVAFDVLHLHEIKKIQEELIKRLDMEYLIYHIQMPLVSILGEIEITGFVHNSKKWIDYSKAQAFKARIITRRLNKYVQICINNYLDFMPDYVKFQSNLINNLERLRTRLEKQDSKIKELEERGKTHLKSYEVLKETRSNTLVKFMELNALSIEETEPTADINWSSTNQVIAVLEELKIPLPKAKDNTTKQMKPSISKEARINWLVNYIKHPFYLFMRSFDRFRNIIHNINTFGESWVEKYTNPVTGKVHTIFKQASTSTGRFSSGDKLAGFPNIQQIPAKPQYRECFGTDEGRSIATIDFDACETVMMVGLSGDLELKKLTELPDSHSYMGTKCWRAVYANRYKETGDIKWKELSETYEMSKNTPEARKKFKNTGIFPVIYGVHNKKIATSQGFTQQEGQIFIDTIAKEMPNIMKFVNDNAQFVLTHGYVIHNKRTNSRRWFPKVLEASKNKKELEFMDKINAESEAKNTCIQGSNADLIQECMVTIDRWARLYKLDIRCLLQCHDELAYDFPDSYIELGIPQKIEELMCRVAQNYLIPEISMKASTEIGKTWIK